MRVRSVKGGLTPPASRISMRSISRFSTASAIVGLVLGKPGPVQLNLLLQVRDKVCAHIIITPPTNQLPRAVPSYHMVSTAYRSPSLLSV